MAATAASGTEPGSVLLVVHGLPPDEHTGTPLVAYGYATALARSGWAVTVLAMGADAPPWGDLEVVQCAGEPFARVPVRPITHAGSVWTVDAPVTPLDPTPSGRSLGAWRAGAGAAEAVHARGPDDAIRRLLHQIRPSVVHVVDNVHLPLSIPEIAHHVGIPVVRTVACAEDLCALVAPVSTCSGPEGYCAAPLTVAHCSACVAHCGDPAWAHFAADARPVVDIRRREHLTGLLQVKRARAVTHFTSVYDRVVFASAGFRAYFEQTLPLDPSRTRTIPMGVDLPAAAAPAVRTRAGGAEADPGAEPQPGTEPERGTSSSTMRSTTSAARGPGAGSPLTFLLLATADPAKGISVVVDAFTSEELSGRDDWRLVLAGGGDRSRFGALLDDRRVTDYGPYRPEDLPRLTGLAEVGLSTSVFETFHRVTREYLAGGLAVVGATAFGISDIVVHGTNGLRFEHRDPASLRRVLLDLVSDRALVDRLRRGASSTAIRRVDDEVADIAALYREVLGTTS